MISTRTRDGHAPHYALSLFLLLSFLCCGQFTSASESDLRIDADTCAVMAIEGEGGILWIGTTKGLYKWEDAPDRLPQQVEADTGTVRVFLRDGNTLWVGAEKGLFRWDDPARGGAPRAIQNSPPSVTKLQKFGPRLLIGATNGLHVWQDTAPATVTHLEIAGQFVNAFLMDGDGVWIGSERGLLRWNGEDEEPTPITLGVNIEVTSLHLDGATLLVGTSAGLLRWVDAPAGSPGWVFDNIEVFSLYKDGSTLLVSTKGKGLLRFDDVHAGRRNLVDDRIGTSSKYYRNGPILWMGAGFVAEAGLYRWDTEADEKPRRLDKINTGFIHNFYRSGDRLWIGAQNGLFRIEGLESDWDAKLQITSSPPKNLTTDSTSPISWQVGNFGWRTTPQQAQYRVVVQDAAGREVMLPGLEVTGRQDLTLPLLPEGEYVLYVQAADLNGKVTRSQTIRFPVVRSLKATLFKWLPGAVIGYGALILLAIILAPHRKFWHDLLMNPWLRKVGSFGTIPLALTIIPAARRHVLKRYLGGIAGEGEFSKWQDRFVMPTDDFLPESFGAELVKERRLILQGQSGVGKTSYFKYLTGYYARKTDTPPARAVPVYIPLARYRSEPPEDMFSDQLSNYGRLTDKKLNYRFLEQGGFVIFLDGLNEIDQETRDKVYAFVERYWKANYFCVSSQHPHPELAGMRQIRLAPLNEDKIHALLRKRLGDEKAREIIDQFGGGLSKIYGIPQDLEFAIAFKRRNPTSPLPGSTTELYEATFSPILDAWVEEGRTDYPHTLLHRAYEMLLSGDPFFNDPDAPPPDDLTAPLVDNKYLIRRGDHYMFRHDLVRSYLASKYFVRRLPDLLSADGIEVDHNWRRMLEFTILNINGPAEAKGLLEWVLVKNRRLAGELFSWMENNAPSMINGWAYDFKLKFADAMLLGARPV